MPVEGWKELIGKSWGDYVILHNLPFCFKKKNEEIKITIKSYYEMQKSAKDWHIEDFNHQDLSSCKDFH